jgi:LacI family transcriptional regulator
MRKLGEQGLTIPHDVAVASYDDLPVAALFRPSLTTLRQPTRELATAAMAIVTGDAPADSVLLRGELILRESSARL